MGRTDVKIVKVTDVALKAGVSPSTVWHVLSGKRPISAEKGKRDRATIELQGYIPNYHASTMKSNRSNIIRFYVTDITEAFITCVIRGVEKQLNEKEITLLFCAGAEFEHDLFKALCFLMQKKIDRLIICYRKAQKSTIPDLPEDIRAPLLSINRDFSSFWPVPDFTFIPQMEEMGEKRSQTILDILDGAITARPQQLCRPSPILYDSNRFQP